MIGEHETLLQEDAAAPIRLKRGERFMAREDIISGKKILIVDDEPDVLDTLGELLSMATVERASNYEGAKALLENRSFDVAVLDIMGVRGYDLLEICSRKNITTVMLTAYALTPDDVKKSYTGGASYYLPKEEMTHITSFLADILEAKAHGKSTWEGWYKRLAHFCEMKFGPDWQKKDKDFWERFPFY
jgi:CheY-like chemotaxis protein